MRQMWWLLCALALVLPGRAEEAANPAGVIIYAETPNGVELLLADHAAPSDRGWAAFGGTHERGETIAQTAARETEEETRGFFKHEDILRVIEREKPVFDGPYAFYFLKVEKVPAEEIAAHAIPNRPAYRERGPYAWIPYSEIKKFFDPDTVTFPLRIDAKYLPEDRRTDWVWPVWLHGLAQAAAENALPWAAATKAKRPDDGGS